MRLPKLMAVQSYLIISLTCFIIACQCSSHMTDDLADFEFENAPKSQLKQHFEYYDDEDEPTEEPFIEDFVSIEDVDVENQKNPFDVKEKFLRTALSKALTNKALRQKFVEVTPILRVLSSQQRLALSALISAQINAKPGTELKLDQVRAMFGDSKKLILPLVFDIANLVRNAAKSSLHFQYELFPRNKKPQPPKSSKRFYSSTQKPIGRRTLDVIDLDENDANNNQEIHGIGEISLETSMIDPKTINHELSKSLTSSEEYHEKQLGRSKRSVFSPPLTQINTRTEQQDIILSTIPANHQSRGFHERKLNISSFAGPTDQAEDAELSSTSEIEDESSNPIDTTTIPGDLVLTLNQVEDLAFADLNGTIIESLESESEVVSNSSINQTTSGEITEDLPIAEALIAGPRIRKITNNKIGNGPIRKLQNRLPAPIRPRPPVHPVTPKSCERFTASMCIRANDYPTDQIMGSIRRHKHAMSALLAEYRDKAAELEYQEYLEEINLNKKRRDDQNGVTPGGMCSSIVRYARPQKARSASGEWKFIVNTGQHTQTLRLEKCSQPQESCSYLSDNYRSRCIQVYNYHRLLSWDKNRGLHVDIFKIPSCCSCHVDGYREQFPPLGGTGTKSATLNKIKNFNGPSTSTINNNSGGGVGGGSSNFNFDNFNQDIEYEEEEDDDEDIDENESVAYQFANGFKRIKGPSSSSSSTGNDFLHTSSSNIKSRFENKPKKPTPTLGSFLSPPIKQHQHNIDIQELLDHNNYKYNRGASTSHVPSLGANNIYNKNLQLSTIQRNQRRPLLTSGIGGIGGIGGGAGGGASSGSSKYLFDSISSAVDDRSDIDQNSSGTDQIGKEVTVYSTTPTNSIFSPKRKRISYVLSSTVKSPKFTTRIQYTSPSPAYYTNGSLKTSYPTNIETSTTATNSRRTPTKSTATATPTPTTRKTYNRPTTETATATGTAITNHESSSSFTTKRTRIQPLFSTKLTNIKLDGGNKRINYNYHPIIDFFEDDNQQSSLEPASALPKNYVLSPNRKLSKDSRIGLFTNFNEDSLNINNWHPILGISS